MTRITFLLGFWRPLPEWSEQGVVGQRMAPPGLCRRGGRDAEGGFGGLLFRLWSAGAYSYTTSFLGGSVEGSGVSVLLGGVLALLGLGRVLPGLVQGKACVRVRLALPAASAVPALPAPAWRGAPCPGLLPLLFSFNAAVLFLGSAILVDAVLDHDLVTGVGVGLPLSYFHYLLAVRTRYGLYVNAALPI